MFGGGGLDDAAIVFGHGLKELFPSQVASNGMSFFCMAVHLGAMFLDQRVVSGIRY
jgi:hypothetical protein